MNQIKGIDLPVVTDWLAANLDGFPAPYRFDLIAAGGSNLTYLVTAGNGKRFILRRPPLSARLATAHDMRREYNIMTALGKSKLPVPEMLALCDDESVNGARFYCMEMVDGLILRDRAASEGMTRQDCLRATESLIDAQIAFHQVNLEAVGLADLSRHDGYLERQLARWKKQVEVAKTRDLPLIESLHETLSKSIPAARVRPGLAHGDYRFDNTILNNDYQVSAVLDWELCTIGDPVADFVWSLNYWAEPNDSLFWSQDPPTRNPLFPLRNNVIELYQERSGYAVNDLGWYMAFSWWKQACIVEGVYNRMRHGAVGGMKVESVDLVGERVVGYLKYAQVLL